MQICLSCPRKCTINRMQSQGMCGATDMFEIASHCLHVGEEPVISGMKGSGTIFFAHCNLKCIFCQNFEISQEGLGKMITADAIVSIMLNLQEQGAHNINLVSPTQYALLLPPILKQARKKGLVIPVVYNSNGYDSVEALKKLEGLIDIYLPDMKYSDNQYALHYSGVHNYVEYSQAALEEMFRQVGVLQVNDEGVATNGLLVRHLVLPENISGSYEVLDFLMSVSPQMFISIMAQYFPCYHAKQYSLLSRSLVSEEYDHVVQYAETLGMQNVFVQELCSKDLYLPDFKSDKPFNKK